MEKVGVIQALTPFHYTIINKEIIIIKTCSNIYFLIPEVGLFWTLVFVLFSFPQPQ